MAGPMLKVAIIGSGPSAFYAASRILSHAPSSSSLQHAIRVHMYDSLWAPHGLVRYGVAPDHPEVKVSLPALPCMRYVVRALIENCDSELHT